MPIFNLFSKRQKALNAEPSDILIYNSIPLPLRVQIIHILNDAFGDSYNGYSEERVYEDMHEMLCREYGLFHLNGRNTYRERINEFILKEENNESVIDAIEVAFRYIDIIIRPDWNYKNSTRRKISEDDAIAELNERFKQHAVGYQYEFGELIKVDSTYVHAEIVKPVLQLLYNKKFSGANEEYLKAHEHYRHGRNKECLTECLKAFESTMKIICTAKGWSFNATDTAKPLVNAILTNNLIPSYMQSQISAFRSLLESGIPTIRNKVGGHGQGATPTTADDETTRYALNLTGSNLIYLIELSNL
ncbi:STM4504/CBY_0614 family protein [Mucilaginibacter angelicae]|uniref:STM4504/CBY_0614 family protein n=1 Tax=Mucilaginibacter angelicae TaxID=869718 RepID=A0ABV6L6V6_9SPHI